MYFLNEKIIDDSDFESHKDKLYVCEDERFEGDVVSIGGNYALRCAIVNWLEYNFMEIYLFYPIAVIYWNNIKNS